MTDISVQRARFDTFTEDEREVLYFALQERASAIMEDAIAEKIDRDVLVSAGGMYHLAGTLIAELGATLGVPPQSSEGLSMVASAIAQGEAPLFGLGDHGDVPVSQAEDVAAGEWT